MRKIGTLAVCLALAQLALGISAIAGPYPDRPINLVIPYGPGGFGDIVARAISESMRESLGQPLVIVNRPGAAGTIGANQVARSEPDGYTLLLGLNSELVIAPNFEKNVPYNLGAFEPIGLAAVAPMILIARKQIPAKTLKEFVALAKEKPDSLTAASSGSGSFPHIASEVFQKAAGIKLRHIPYKGGAPAINDVVGGHVDIFFAAIPPALPQVQSGNVKTFGITGRDRSATAPEIPTLAEEGVSGVYLNAWFGLLAPAGLPADIRVKLTEALRKALASREVHDIFRKNGAKPGDLFGQEFRVFLNTENDAYRQLIAAAKLAPE